MPARPDGENVTTTKAQTTRDQLRLALLDLPIVDLEGGSRAQPVQQVVRIVRRGRFSRRLDVRYLRTDFRL